MKGTLSGFIFSGCFLIMGVFLGYFMWNEYTRVGKNPLPEPVRVERGVFREADIVLGGEINEQATVRLGSYSEFEGFARKHNEHPIVVASVVDVDESVIIQYLLPGKRYYFREKIGHQWGNRYKIDSLAFDGSGILLHARRDIGVFMIPFVMVPMSFGLSLFCFPWRAVRSLHPATT